MKPKPVKAAYRREFRRQFDQGGEPLPPPAETRQEADNLVMTIAGMRYIGKKTKQGFFWIEEAVKK